MLALFGALAFGLAADAAHAPHRCGAGKSHVTRGLPTVRRSDATEQQPGCASRHTSIYARGRARYAGNASGFRASAAPRLAAAYCRRTSRSAPAFSPAHWQSPADRWVRAMPTTRRPLHRRTSGTSPINPAKSPAPFRRWPAFLAASVRRRHRARRWQGIRGGRHGNAAGADRSRRAVHRRAGRRTTRRRFHEQHGRRGGWHGPGSTGAHTRRLGQCADHGARMEGAMATLSLVQPQGDAERQVARIARQSRELLRPRTRHGRKGVPVRDLVSRAR